jgi:transcriptional regulator with XRE-family HTH domain
MKNRAHQNLVFDHNKLREARIRKFPDKSMSSVASDLLQISPQRLHRYETGEDNPTPTTLAQMCALYGIELRQLTSQRVA